MKAVLRGRDRRGAGRRSAAVRLAAVLAALAAAGLTVTGCMGSRALATGDTASNFTLPSLTDPGQRIALSDYAGRPLIINFFASWSPPCLAETQLLGHFYRFYHHKVLIIGVDSRDDPGAALTLLRTSLAAYPVATDRSLAVATRYGVPGVPATYFLDAKHQIVRTDLGWLDWKKLRQGVADMNSSTFVY
jgi:cytochrome c biogenesis protein CcmG, thiol:disulfide interchange protein DsbE